ncbi:MAG: hypothetical protein CL840_21945 [Crocinitomicaceae bacterium]|nr:hypothetical protein [Crocinitomicaceae bacterium]|tara:strand:+ start:12259 stop:13698 length:1440 start_codon:yes stop_codon:yes gene_type:complete
MAKEQLFDDFSGFSKAEWKQKIETDLKGKPYQSLVSVNGSGIEVEPVYTSEDLNLDNESPGSGSYRRGSKVNNNEWVIDEMFETSNDVKADNARVLKMLNSGLTSLSFSGSVAKEVLAGVLPEHVNLGFSRYSKLSDQVQEVQAAFGNEINDYKIYFNYDPIGSATINGNWNQPNELQVWLDSLASLKNYSSSKLFSVSGHNYHNAGGNAISELAFTLAHAHEYVVYLLENGYSIDDASAQFKIDLASGGDYFLEIAKVRAFRMLWAKLISTYNPKYSCSKSIIIHSHTSQYLSTVYDPYVNMLRGTTQAMSAVLGGCDILRVLPYDTAWSRGGEFSRRIARNVQLMLKEESYLDKVIDPAGGSYYIDRLTNELGNAAWEKFRKIEKKGGFIGLMESGNLDRELKEDHQLQLNKLTSNELQVLGVSLYPNPDDKMLDQLNEVESAENNNIQSFKPISLVRLVGELEEERLEKEIEEVEA